MSKAFHRIFRLLHGFDLHAESPSARIMARSIANMIVSHDHPSIAFETLTATSGVRKSVVSFASRQPSGSKLKERIATRWTTLIGMNALPLRLANGLCALGAACAVLYSLYVIAVYAFKQDVAPGWTTVSLLLSVMFLMISLVLWLISEYMILLLESSAKGARYAVVEEQARSYPPTSRLSANAHLSVLGQAGAQEK